MIRNCLYQVNIADGFADDCDELLHRCSKYEVLTYEAFSNIWKEMCFANIYKERPSGAEIAELSEEVLHIAKHYMVADTSNFEESVAGVFLVYGLLSLQPFPSFAWLRVVPDDVPAISRIEQVARRERRLDVLYILGSILTNHSQYHAIAREHGLEIPLRKYIEGCTTIDRQGVRPKGVFYRQNEELDMIRELKHITKMYTDAKASITEGKPPDRNLNYIDTDLPATLDSSMKKIMSGLIEDDLQAADDAGQGNSKPDHHSLVQSIKQRAMQSSVVAMRHLTGIEERSPNSTSPTKTSENTTKSKKKKRGGFPVVQEPTENKSASSSKSTKNTRKRKLTTKGHRGKRKRKISTSSEEEEDDDDDVCLESDDDCLDDLNLKDFAKVDSEHEELDKPQINVPNEKTPENNPIEANVLTNLNFESLPVFLQTDDQSRLIQIEIIDNHPNDENILITEDVPEIGTPIITNATVTSTQVNKGSECSASPQASDNDDQLFKKPAVTKFVLKKPDKSLLKKTVLKSKFKRLGMLPVANFKEDDNDK